MGAATAAETSTQTVVDRPPVLVVIRTVQDTDEPRPLDKPRGPRHRCECYCKADPDSIFRDETGYRRDADDVARLMDFALDFAKEHSRCEAGKPDVLAHAETTP